MERNVAPQMPDTGPDMRQRVLFATINAARRWLQGYDTLLDSTAVPVSAPCRPIGNGKCELLHAGMGH